jgi:hypothetical protein
MAATERALSMKIGLAALLVVGLLLSADSLAFGASALSTDLNASSAQYGKPHDIAHLLGSSGGESVGLATSTGSKPAGVTKASPVDVAPRERVRDVARNPVARAIQVPRQLDVSTHEGLPFTGLSLVPILLIGIALIGLGSVLRSGAGTGRAAAG